MAVSRLSWSAVCASSLLATLVLLGLSGRFVQPPHQQIQVRWQDSVDPEARATLERRFQLLPIQQIAQHSWRYELTDASRAAMRALISDQTVADTHWVDRSTFEVLPDAPRGERRAGPWGQRWPTLASGLVDWGRVLLLAAAVIAGLFALRPHLALTAAERVPRLLTRGVPALSPRALALFRLAFGAGLALYVFVNPFPGDVLPLHLRSSDMALLSLAPIRWLVDHPFVVQAGQWIAIGSASLFAVGCLPRLMYASVTTGIVLWLLALSAHQSAHAFGVLLPPLVALLAAPWHLAPPLWDSRISRSEGREGAHKRYGYAPWMLGLALGVAWVGAAWAKLRDGPDWVLNGSVRYHLVTDYVDAHLDWGLTIAAIPLVAVMLSAGTVLVEGLLIGAAFIDRPRVRLAMGLVAMGLLTGFFLLQGVLWPAWWLLLLGFLPWHWFNGAQQMATPVRATTLSRGQLWCVVALLCQQLVVSTAFIELPPFASRYDMYSKTYDSTEEFDREAPVVSRRLLAIGDRGQSVDVSHCATHLDRPEVAGLLKFDPAARLPPATALSACDPHGLELERYVIVEDRCGFNWSLGHYDCSYTDKVIGVSEVGD